MEAQRVLRFIILSLVTGALCANEHKLTDLEVAKKVQNFARDVNQHYSSNYLLKEQSQPQNSSKLMVFISNSMAPKSIQQWAQQAQILGATLVIRGFVNNSFRQTIILAQNLFNKDHNGGFIVDPFKFKEYAIDVVPTVVLASDIGVDYVRGDIGLIEALKVIRDKGQNYLEAQNLLSQM